MVNKFKALGLAVAAASMLPLGAMAATIEGQLEIGGTVNLSNSTFAPAGSVDLNTPGFVLLATGDFGGLTPPESVTLSDIDFANPGVVWAVGGFTYTATSYTSIFDNGTLKGFESLGVVSGTGFDDTVGYLDFSTQGDLNTVSFSISNIVPAPTVPLPAAGLLLIAGLGSLAVAGRKKS